MPQVSRYSTFPVDITDKDTLYNFLLQESTLLGGSVSVLNNVKIEQQIQQQDLTNIHLLESTFQSAFIVATYTENFNGFLYNGYLFEGDWLVRRRGVSSDGLITDQSATDDNNTNFLNSNITPSQKLDNAWQIKSSLIYSDYIT